MHAVGDHQLDVEVQSSVARSNSSDDWVKVATLAYEQNNDVGQVSNVVRPVNVARELYPCSIVWTPIPPITMFLPFVGHLGIADSRGVIYDFAGPYTIGERHLAFGGTSRYVQLSLDKVPGGAQAWDEAVHAANEVYCKKMHNLFCQNCHHHVAMALNTMSYDGSRSWSMVKLGAWAFLVGKFTSTARMVYCFLPSLIFYCLVAFLMNKV